MKLYATLETSKGKVVSVSDDNEIVATVYDKNMKAYSVIISWCDIGDLIDNDGNELPEIKKTKGAIVTTREWRNQEDDRRKTKGTCKHCKFTNNIDIDKDGLCGYCRKGKRQKAQDENCSYTHPHRGECWIHN